MWAAFVLPLLFALGHCQVLSGDVTPHIISVAEPSSCDCSIVTVVQSPSCGCPAIATAKAATTVVRETVVVNPAMMNSRRPRIVTSLRAAMCDCEAEQRPARCSSRCAEVVVDQPASNHCPDCASDTMKDEGVTIIRANHSSTATITATAATTAAAAAAAAATTTAPATADPPHVQRVSVFFLPA